MSGGVTGTRLVPIKSRRHRRAQALQRLQDLIPAAALLLAGAHALGRGAAGLTRVMGAAQVVVGAAMVLLVLRVLRHNLASTLPDAPAHESPVDWVEVGAGCVLLLGAWQQWHDTRHVPRPTVLTGLVTLVVGLNHARLARATAGRRAIRLTDEHLSIGGRFRWRRFRARWDQLAEVTITPTEARVRSVTGAAWRIDLSDCDNAGEVVAALEEARGRATGLAIGPTSAAPPEIA